MAGAVVTGAGIAFAAVTTGYTSAGAGAAQDHQVGTSVSVPTVSTPTAKSSKGPAPNQILPFNAKITSHDIPVRSGGVRSGGCSGSLIAPDWIITAGHCFHDVNDVRISGRPSNTITVTVGKGRDSDSGGHSAQVIDVRQSPVNDIAIARLATPVADVTPLTLADAPPAVGQQLRFAGWGSLSATVVAPSDHLKQGQFAVLTVGPTSLEADSVVARTVENSPCPIDSGAPYFVSDDDRTGTLVAVESSGPPCPQPGRETISRVDVVAEWIHEQINATPR